MQRGCSSCIFLSPPRAASCARVRVLLYRDRCKEGMVFTLGSAPRACVPHAERRSHVESRVEEELLESWFEGTSDHTLESTSSHREEKLGPGDIRAVARASVLYCTRCSS